MKRKKTEFYFTEKLHKAIIFGTIKVLNEVADIPFFPKNKIITDGKISR